MVIAVLSGFVLAVLAPWLHRRLPPQWSGWVLAILPATLTAYFFAQPVPHVESYEWASDLGLRLSFAFDGLARLFALLIAGIGTLVLIYAGDYLHGHERLGRFHAYLLAFMASMLGVVLADNLLVLFVFWELTSLTSYLLIGFDQHRPEARAAALQSLLVTAGGGLALLAGLLLLGRAAGTYELSELVTQGDALRAHALYVPLLLLVLAGAFTKSAQTPFHFWLPNAMAAPTPASAYLHSSTMVKAGIYLLARLTPALAGTAVWQVVVGGVGAVTMVTGAMLAFGQSDVKRLLAYATVSALGILTMLLGVGGEAAVVAALVFLLAHAFYKGALFLVAGGLTHATGERDVTKLGGLAHAMPITATAATMAAVSMAGVLPFAGFFGKELAIEAVWHAPILPVVLTTAMVFAAALLVGVALAAGLQPFFGRGPTGLDAHEGPPGLWIGAAALAAIGLVAGLVPNVVVAPLVSAAASSVLGTATDVRLSLWHGWNVALALGTASLVSGVVLYRQMGTVRARVAGRTQFVAGPTAWYAWAFDGLNTLAVLLTRLIQGGYLRRYLLVTVAVTVALIGAALVAMDEPIVIPWTEVRPYEFGLAVAVLLAAIGTVRARSSLGAVAALGTVGFGLALIFAMFGAPDLAMTQLVVEALLVILFVLVLYDVPQSPLRSNRRQRLRDLVLASVAGVLMTVLVLAAATVQLTPTISGYFVDSSVPLGHGRNVVNVILVDFRALDTLGELTVIAIAAVGVYALIRHSRGEKPR
jgi:multicomponent Na+:H+ antiporter subunit A